jgi:hypothetical protein
MSTKLKQLVASLLLALIALPANVLASSHMDAPLIISIRRPTQQTSMPSSIRTDQKSLVLALGVYPHQEPGIGPNKYNFDDNVPLRDSRRTRSGRRGRTRHLELSISLSRQTSKTGTRHFNPTSALFSTSATPTRT